MIVRPIRYLGDPVLRKKAKQVKLINENIFKLDISFQNNFKPKM